MTAFAARTLPERPSAQGELRVLHLIDNLGMGGAEAWLMELFRYWDRVSPGAVQNDVVATGGGPGVFDDEARALGVRIFYVRFGRRDVAGFTREFRQILHGGAYDALHDHQDHASGWHYLLGHGALPRVRVTHVHNPAYQIRNNYGVTLRRRLTGRLGKALVGRYATHIVGTSREAITAYGFDAPCFDGVPKAALHCGFEPRRFLAGPAARAGVREEFGWPADSQVVLFAGRFDISADPGHPQNHKNSGFAVSVAIECARRNDRLRFVFAGPLSPAVPILRRRIEDAGLGARIAFAGIRRDIGGLMAGSDALLFPSRSEGLGMVAVEAQAAGIPVLASTGVPRECVVIPDLVRFLELEAGLGVWTDRLLELLAAPRPNPGQANGRVAASPFSIEHSARTLAGLYRRGVLG